MMPNMNGYEVCRLLKDSPETADIAVILLRPSTKPPARPRGSTFGAVGYITKPFDTAEVKARVRTHVELRRIQEELNDQNRILKRKVEEKTALTQKILRLTIQSMSQMAESRDPYTAGHQQRVSQLACAIAQKMAMTAEDIDTIRRGGPSPRHRQIPDPQRHPEPARENPQRRIRIPQDSPAGRL